MTSVRSEHYQYWYWYIRVAKREKEFVPSGCDSFDEMDVDETLSRAAFLIIFLQRAWYVSVNKS